MGNLLRTLGFAACLAGIGIAVAGYLYPDFVKAWIGVPVSLLGAALVASSAIKANQ